MIPEKEFTVGWDWYGATVETDPDSLVARIAEATQATPELLSRAGRWSCLWKLHRGEDVICTVAYTDDRPAEPFFEAKSHSPELVPMFREWFPAHRVARVDARIDFKDELWWHVIEAEMLHFARAKDVRMEPIGPHKQPHLGGRTWNLGKSASWQRCCTLYEKGCELRLPTRCPIRLEAKARPPSKLKANYADLTIREVLLDNAFIRYLCERIDLDLGSAKVATVERNRTDLDRLLDVFARQYLATFKQLAERYASMQELRDELQRRADLDAEIRDFNRNARVTQAWAD
jgi:hypothetical protein